MSSDTLQPSRNRSLLTQLRVDESGQDLIEYSLLASLVALVAVGAVGLVGQSLRTALWDPMATATF